jgi:hypothetical protein
MNKPILLKTVAMLVAGLALGAGSAMADGRYDQDSRHDRGYERHHEEPKFGFWGFPGGHHYGDRGIDARQYSMRQRIAEGIRSGELTRYEAQRLFEEQHRIALMERNFRSDGVLSPWELRVLDREMDETSRYIFRQKHDSDDRNHGWR